MHGRFPYRTVLARLGFTRFCAVTLIAYFAFCFGFEQALPDGERLVRAPWHFPMVAFPLILAIATFLISRELRKLPRWRDLGWVLLTTGILFSLLVTFGYVKSLIPEIVPFYLDPMLQRIELMLHGGTLPFDYLKPHLADQHFVWLQQFYGFGWPSGIFLYFFWQLFSPGAGEGRIIYLSCFATLWILAGNLLALVFASVGPALYGFFYTDAFTAGNQAIAEFLYGAGSPIAQAGGTAIRDMLLGFQHDSAWTAPNGISAMPSMHNAIALLMVYHSAFYARRLLWLTVPFALLVFVGSFMLGWHYAIDAYAALVVVHVLWWLNRRSHRAYTPPARPAAG